MTVRFEPLEPCPGPSDLGRCPDNALIDTAHLARCNNCSRKWRKRQAQAAKREGTK